MPSFDSLLDRYAELIVRVGLNVQPQQRVFVRGTRGEPEFVHRVARTAYRAGASLVHVLWEDDALDLIRVQESPRENLELPIDWYLAAFNNAAARGDAILLLHTPDPELFGGIDPEKVATNRRTRLGGLKPMLEAQSRNEMQWTVCNVPTPRWADRVFLHAAPEVREQKLWDAIFAVTRADQPDPVTAWRSHIGALTKRREFMTAKQYHALHFKSPQTDLTLGLALGHIWCGGDSTSSKGISFAANIPSEEIFTMPDRARADGRVKMTRPLSIGGVMINNLTFTFQEGRVTGMNASNGQDVLEKLVATDEGSSHLGEIALVPASNPIGRMNLIFYDGLFDENAASHFALGRSYRFTVMGGAQMTKDELQSAGGNESMIHEDTMIGSDDMDVDGICADGTREPVMRAGEWAFPV
jgi:aminopeptidase